ncbi:MAG: bifunctional hydroxymethylpyrimidine kinase/phosphomethylpyrimidine kinase [Verrucomicrobia bacterium]|nr:bifunctional hydroxymethylpyrimidine kinase/phosphomethylpyrimidine kinase [Verrucomicrobiota bacterium]
MKKYLRALTIAGSDSGGGAGIQADLKTFFAFGCFGMSAITAITAQNTVGVQAVFSLPPSVVEQQLHSILSDIGTDAIKIGMLFDPQIIEVVTSQLSQVSTPIILDPVMASTSGDCLLKKTSLAALWNLLPLALLVTPNLYEASELLHQKITTQREMEKAAIMFIDRGIKNVLIKGGHLPEAPGSDCFCSQTGQLEWLTHPPVATKNTHGTGCTLSAAIAALVAKKHPLKEAIQQAKSFLHSALCAGANYQLGSGLGPLNFLHD